MLRIFVVFIFIVNLSGCGYNDIQAYDEQTNYLTVKGKDWPDFKLTMKMALENGKWVVDGSGIVNIPENEQAER